MRSSKSPTLFLSVVSSDGVVTTSPLFAAVQVTAGLCYRLRLLANLAERHRIDYIEISQRYPPVYWHVDSGSKLDGIDMCMTQWEMCGSIAVLALWGFLPQSGHVNYAPMRLASTMYLDVQDLVDLRESGYVVDYREHEETEATIGEPFEVAVRKRLTLLNRHPNDLPPDG